MNNTLIKGLRLLEVLAARESTMGVAELARELDIGRSNVHRILQALVEMGYVVNEGGNYRASIKVWELGARSMKQPDLREAASPHMHWLLERSNETVHLSVLNGDHVVYIDKLDSLEPVRAYSEIGGRAPAYCVATGKVLLAWQDSLDAGALLAPPKKLHAHTNSTLTDTHGLARELNRIRTQGYAVNRGEWRTSVWGIGAPIVDGQGRALAALGISGPAQRIRSAGLKPLAGLVTQAAAKASEALTRTLGQGS